MTFTLEDAKAIALEVHSKQRDKAHQPYMLHVRAVAAGLADFDLDLQIAGMLHDVVEDSLKQIGRVVTIDELRERGVPERSLDAIALVSNNLHPDPDYDAGIKLICTSADARLVKISDNAHNSLPQRIAGLDGPPNERYARARRMLYAATPRKDVETILRRVNPSLLTELPE